MLEGHMLAFRYGHQHPWLFRRFSIQIAPGEIVGLRGPSGSGKTTIGKVLAGYLFPEEGHVAVDEISLSQHGYAPVQLIFQHPELAVNPRWRIDRVLQEGQSPSDELLDAFQIDRGWLRRWPHELSGGELQRIAVARALGPQTRYLIADEMTAMLDANTQAQIWQAINTLVAQRSFGVLVMSHEDALLKRLCERVVTLDAA